MAQALVKLDRSTSMPQPLLVTMYAICTSNFHELESCHEKTCLGFLTNDHACLGNSDCATTESTWMLKILDGEISDKESREILLSRRP